MIGDVIETTQPSSRRYQLTDQLAWQELSVTYRARDLETGTWVALRRLRPGIAASREALRRFEREFELLSTLRHPTLVRALAYGWDDEGPFFTTELVEGRELITVAPLHWRSVCVNLRRLASVLAMLHTRGVLHGRLSPGSVLVTKDGSWKLSELSNATTLGATSALRGAYAAPEASTACLDARADAYSLGVLAFFALTGEHILAPRSLPSIPSLVRDVPPALDMLVRSLAHLDRDLRPASMAEVIARLNAIGQLDAEPNAARVAQSYLATPPLHGQDGALAAISAALRELERGRSKTLKISGDGARRLRDEALRLAQFRGWRVKGETLISAQQGELVLVREGPADLTIAVEPLSREQSASLVRCLFGDVPRVELAAHWLHQQSAGNAARIVTSARELVDAGHARLLDGVWSLPTRRPELQARPPLQEGALSLLRATPTPELASSLLAHLRTPSASPEQLHARLAEAWLAHSEASWCKVEAAWHLLEARQSERAVQLLARTVAADPLVHVAGEFAPYGQVFAAALRFARSDAQRLPLYCGLAHAGVYEDAHWSRQHGDDALAVVARVTGLGLAKRWSRWIGPRLSLALATGVTALRTGFTAKRLARSYELALGTVMALIGSASSCLDVERAQTIASTLEPLYVLREREPIRTLLRLAEGLQLLATDSPARAHDALSDVIDALGHSQRLPANMRTFLSAGAHAARGMLAVHRLHDDAAQESADHLTHSGLPVFVSLGALIRQLSQAQRGNQLRDRSDTAGACWLPMPWEQASRILPALTTGDSVQLRQLADALQSSELPSLRSYQRLAHKAARWVDADGADMMLDRQQALKLTLVGQHEGCVFAERALIGSARVQASLAALLNAAERHQDARDVCATALARMEPGDQEFTALFLELELQHALALSGLGEERDATAELDRLFERVHDSQHPLVLARVHEVRALVALTWSRGASFQHELALAERWYRTTSNSTALARVERLAVRARNARHELAALPAAHPFRERKRA